MARIKERELVQKMRRGGASIKDIEKKLHINRGTVSYWCRDILLSAKQIEILRKRQKREGIKALLRSAEKKRAERLTRVEQFNIMGKKDVGKLTTRDLFLVGLSLYWGEGYKKGNEEFGFTNSDPSIIKFIIKWLKEIYNINRDDLILRISINHVHKSRSQALIHFWLKETGVSSEQFTKTSFIKTKSKKIYENHNQHFGTLRIKVRRGTNLRRRILGSINRLEEFVNRV